MNVSAGRLVLVTGATGFIGHAVVRALRALPGYAVRASVRRGSVGGGGVETVIAELAPDTDWTAALAGAEVVVHTAARVHVMNDQAADPLAEFRRANVAGTLALARQAAGAGVRRFVFISSVKVNGELTQPGQPFTADDAPAPQDAYGISKMEAEQGLRKIAANTGMELVIIRPPLVHGPGVRANFRSLMMAVARGLPLPLAAVDNRRSLIGVDNLVDFIVTCVQHPAAAGQTFLVSDGEDLSTSELIRRLGRAMGKPARLFWMPNSLLQAAARLLGRREMMQRLCGNLQVDISAARGQLGWRPQVSVDEGLRRATAGLEA